MPPAEEAEAALPTRIMESPTRRSPQVIQHRSDRGCWQIALGTPNPTLATDVVGYWGYTDSEMRVRRRRKAPTGHVTLIVNFGPVFRLTDSLRPDVTTEPRHSFIAGMHETPVLIESTGDSHCVQVDLTPIGAFRFLGCPMNLLTHRIIELEDVLGTVARQLRAALYDAGDWATRFALLDRMIATRIALGPAAVPDIAWAWAELQRTDGRVGIGTLTEALGCSRQHLIGGFHRQIGLSPKKVARILRLNRILRRLETTDHPDWAGLALDGGYYDQAHFNRDFRHFTGSTPGEFLRHRLPDHRGVASV